MYVRGLGKGVISERSQCVVGRSKGDPNRKRVQGSIALVAVERKNTARPSLGILVCSQTNSLDMGLCT